jgi:hypothetical protein
LHDALTGLRTRVNLDRRKYDIAKELQYLAGLRVTTAGTFGEQQLTVDSYVEDTV